MSLHARYKWPFTAVVLAGLALAAYFQAVGVCLLLADLFGVDQSVRGGTLSSRIPGASVTQAKSARAIVLRNPFDSVTGPLGPNLDEVSAPGRLDSNPLKVPFCEGIRVSIIAEASDPSWSLAALQVSGESAPTLRRAGDEIGGRQVAYIGTNPAKQSPAVWIASATALCQATLFRAHVTPMPAAAPSAALAANKIRRLSDSEFELDRSVIDEVLEKQLELVKSVRIVQERKDGDVVGLRLFGILPGSLLGTLGFENGDRLESINGLRITNPENALLAYARLRSASHLTVTLERRGETRDVDYRIR